jgi:TolB protein
VAPLRQTDLRYARLALVTLAAAALAGCGGGLSEHDQLFVVRADGSNRRQITHGDLSHVAPSWSPEGRRVAFAAARCGLVSLQVVARDGGDPHTLSRHRTCIGDPGVAWSPRGDAVAFLTRYEDRSSTVRLDLVQADGGRARNLVTFTSGRDTDEGPAWSPDAARIAYAGEAGDGSLDVSVVELDGSTHRVTSGPDDDIDPRWSPRGDRILFMREVGGSSFVLMTVRPDGRGASALPGRWEDADASWSPDGTMVAVAGVPVESDGHYRLDVVDTTNGERRELAREPDAVHPAWSPDGRSIAFATQDGRVAAVSPTGGAIRTLADLGDAEIHALAWSPDGSRLVFSAAKPPPQD